MTSPDPLEALMRSLKPTPASIDRDRIHYEAGRAAGTRGVQRWRLASALGLTASVTLFVLGFTQSPTIVVQREVVTIEKPAPKMLHEPVPATDASDDLARWLKLRNQVVAVGIDELPPAPSGQGIRTSLRDPWIVQD